MLMKIRLLSLFVLFSITFYPAYGQDRTDSFMVSLLSKSKSQITKTVLDEPAKYRYQIIYTQINRDASGKPSFTNHYYHVDPNQYFNPASMVKMPLAFLSLEKIQELKEKGISKSTRMAFDSSYERQVAMSRDSSSADGFPSIAHFIKRAFLISENDPYNRMYQFMGQGEINKRLLKKGYLSSRITRQFMGYTEEQNRHTNGINFYDDSGKLIYHQPAAYHTESFHFPSPILIGNAHIDRSDSLVNAPFDFTRHNNISLEDMQKMLQAVIFPESVLKQERFNFSEEDRNFLLQFLSQYPSETNYPNYDETIFHNSYVKFFFNDTNHVIPGHIRVFNKVGWAYGFLTDVSYVIDTLNNIDYMLSATVYVNSDGIVNDSKYDEETIGFPFLKDIGAMIHEYDLKRQRKVKPVLHMPIQNYEKRMKDDKRVKIKVADN